MKLKIIFEDSQILIVDKPTRLVVNRSETIREETLQDQLSEHFNLENDLGIGDRAGIVHRLDRETSGLLIVAKTQKDFDFMQKQFKDRNVAKEYVALVHGLVKDESGSIVGDIGRIGKFGKFGVTVNGREARSDFEVVSRFSFKKDKLERLLHSSGNLLLSKPRINYLKQNAIFYTLLRLFPKTGRTHQVRVHLKSIGHPVVSDLIYTPKKLIKFDINWCPRLFLHAQTLEFFHPKTKKKVRFTSDLPKDLKDAILNL